MQKGRDVHCGPCVGLAWHLTDDGGGDADHTRGSEGRCGGRREVAILSQVWVHCITPVACTPPRPTHSLHLHPYRRKSKSNKTRRQQRRWPAGDGAVRPLLPSVTVPRHLSWRCPPNGGAAASASGVDGAGGGGGSRRRRRRRQPGPAMNVPQL